MKAAVAARDFVRPLQEELGPRASQQHDRLFIYDGEDPAFAQNLWLDAKLFNFGSISEAAKHLRAIQRNWHLHSVAAHRRANLIQEQLPPVKPKLWEFMAPLPKSPMGSWTLLDEGTMLYSAECSSAFPDGELEFVENKTEPPSRAYLKLWELFTLEGRTPQKGERVLDLGSSPGGWTWVLDRLDCEVTSVDKAPLAETLKLSNRTRFINESAFGLEPAVIGKVDWLFSDIICYPQRLFELVTKWEAYARNMVCTIKFQAPTDFASLRKFREFPGARLRHLHCNKHELTWLRLAPKD